SPSLLDNELFLLQAIEIYSKKLGPDRQLAAIEPGEYVDWKVEGAQQEALNLTHAPYVLISPRLRNDKDFMLKLIALDDEACYYVSRSLLNDRKIVTAALKKAFPSASGEHPST